MFNLTFYFSRSLQNALLRVFALTLVISLQSQPLQAQWISSDQQQSDALHNQASNAMQQGNYAIAYCIWKPLADEGDNSAQYNIGWMYHNGYGLSIDDEMAMKWWLKSAASGDANAHFALGDLYIQGQGVEKNLSIALGWYISAALKQHEPARETLLAILSQDDALAQSTIQILLQSEWSILGDTLQVNVDRANVRRGPDTSFQVVSTLERGQDVIPLREQNGWTYIGLTENASTGWIFTALLAKPAGIYSKQ